MGNELLALGTENNLVRFKSFGIIEIEISATVDKPTKVGKGGSPCQTQIRSQLKTDVEGDRQRHHFIPFVNPLIYSNLQYRQTLQLPFKRLS